MSITNVSHDCSFRDVLLPARSWSQQWILLDYWPREQILLDYWPITTDVDTCSSDQQDIESIFSNLIPGGIRDITATLLLNGNLLYPPHVSL
uniref:Uncharacterized protein n=1 Tax=Arion vulgaris TaxID=1028688 RepID=A0A0B7B4P6_9EUPU